MARKTILFVNTGYSDLQFLARCCDNKGSFFARVELDKTNLRKVHEALREERLPYALFNGEHSYEGLNGELRDPARLRNIRAVPFQYNEAGQILLEAPKEKPYEKEPNEIDLELVEKDKKIVIVPAKLWEITHKLLYSGREVIGAYIFQTERNESIGKRHYAQEPVACGSVLARWLGGLFSLRDLGKIEESKLPDVSEQTVGWLNILAEDERMSDPDNSLHYPLHRAAGERIHRLMERVASWDSVRKQEHACGLLLGGGMPQHKPVLTSCARYHFGIDALRQTHKTEDVKGEKKTDWSKLKPAPSLEEIFYVRCTAQELLHQGDFHGAYASTSYLRSWASKRKDGLEKSWIDALKNVRDYFTGLQIKREALLTPFLEPERYVKLWAQQAGDLEFEFRRPPRCLRIGLQIESFLHARQTSQAALMMYSFREAAIFDFFEQILYEHSTPQDAQKFSFEDWEKRMDIPKEIVGRVVDLPGNPWRNSRHPGWQRGQSFSGKFPDSKDIYDWLERQNWPALDGLKLFSQLFERDWGTRSLNLKELRHRIIHQGYAEEHMNRVEEHMRETLPSFQRNIQAWGLESKNGNLWGQTSQETEQGHHFLAQPVTQQIYSSLGLRVQPYQLYKDLVEKLGEKISNQSLLP